MLLQDGFGNRASLSFRLIEAHLDPQELVELSDEAHEGSIDAFVKNAWLRHTVSKALHLESFKAVTDSLRK